MLSFAPFVSLTTVTRISRVADGVAARRRRAAAARAAPAAPRMSPPAAAAHGLGRNDRDLRRNAHRERRDDEQSRALLAAEDVALVAVLHRQAVDDFLAAGQRRASPARRTASAGTAGRTAHRRRTCTGPRNPCGASTAR